ncbi:hypothetical protein BBJ28_00021630 [Nothophytophthora sp. Chile5]|nr:hypothetical protein BBJ28_00021630 [Nothophytophthora sp. Chile5]
MDGNREQRKRRRTGTCVAASSDEDDESSDASETSGHASATSTEVEASNEQPTAPWPNADRRYLRRKAREYALEVQMARATRESKASPTQEEEKEKPSTTAHELMLDNASAIEEGGAAAETPSPARGKVQEQPTATADELTLENASDVEAESAAADMSPATLAVHSPPQIQRAKQQSQTAAIEPTPEKSAPLGAITSRPKKNVARGIAQSSSSASTRKRMISFSPERAPRPENRALALKKLEKNLKTNEKLQLRLEAPTPVKAAAPSRATSPAEVTQTRRSSTFQSPQARRPMTFQSPQSRRPAAFQSPHTASCSIQLSQTEELVYDATQCEVDTAAAATATAAPTDPDVSSEIVAGEEGTATADEEDYTMDEASALAQNDEAMPHSQDSMNLSQDSTSVGASRDEKVTPLSQQSCDVATPLTNCSATPMDSSSFEAFTSNSVIEDVGLFNCDTDVEYTGGIYGEGTDGKVTAAVINGQKVALKRAKPHEGFPDEEAKHRSAVELHYLRRVRHAKGFLQCLGLCDGIEHTCIALEVMDCKLSDYLRKYGVNSGGSKHRRFTLSFDDTKAMLEQICLPMITLHDEVNVAHGDLACRNILLRTPPEGYEQSWKPDIKLSDFGRIKRPADEPKILDKPFSFYKNCDVGSFGREILYRLLVGEIVPKECVETRSLRKVLHDVVVTRVPEVAKTRLGPYYSLFMRCTSWGVRPTFREIYEHLDDLEYFETSENGLFPLKPAGSASSSNSSADSTFLSPVAESGRNKTPSSSGSKAHRLETPTGPGLRPCAPKSRLFSAKSFTGASVPGANKTVNWLKTRSVGAQRGATPQVFTPNARPMLLKKKKTPPSAGAGASRRSLQILNQIQHRTIEKGRKST